MENIKIYKVTGASQDLWSKVGRAANADIPEYGAGKVLWPEIEEVAGDKGYTYLIAEHKGAPVGRLLMKEHSAGKRYVLLEISVAPDLRRKGIGTSLIAKSRETASAAGAEKLSIYGYIDEEEKNLLSFFDKNGFKQENADYYSVVSDLTQKSPEDTAVLLDTLAKEGFQSRVSFGEGSDLELVAGLMDAHFPAGLFSGKEYLPPLFKRGFAAVIAEQAGEICGYILGGGNCVTKNCRHVAVPGYGVLTSIAVDSHFRKKGMAVFMLMKLREYLISKGVHTFHYCGCALGSPSMKVAQKAGWDKLRKHYALSLLLKNTI